LTTGVNFVRDDRAGESQPQRIDPFNAQLLAQLHVLQERVKQLAAELQALRGGGGASPSPPDWVKPNRLTRKKKKRKPRSHGFARKLDPVTSRVEHALDHCPQCQVALRGRRVIKTRQVIELPAVHRLRSSSTS
jgi:hypothetical protein